MDDAAYAAALFGYQRRAVAAMRALEASLGARTEAYAVETRVGVLADPPGSGKTRVVIGLVAGDGEAGAAPAAPAPILPDVVVPGLARAVRHAPAATGARCADTTVVVASLSLIGQWARELARSATCAASTVVVRVPAHVAALERALERGGGARVVLVSAPRYGDAMRALAARGATPRRVVVDEAAHLHDGAIGRFAPDAGFVWLVSACSERAAVRELVPAHSRAFWAHLAALPAEAYRAIVVRTPDAEVAYGCVVEFVAHACALDAPVSAAAHGVVAPEVRRRLEANDMLGAVQLLGGRATEDLMTVVRRRIATDREATRLELAHARLLGDAPKEARLVEREARLERDAAHAEERFGEALAGACAICHDTLAAPVLLTCCQVLFCSECVLAWLRHGDRPCPQCRERSFRLEPIQCGGEAAAAGAPAPRQWPACATKAQTVLEIVRAAPAGVLLYSSYVAGLRRAIALLREAGVVVGELKGRSTVRDRRLRDFADGAIKVLALDATLNCAGLDLLELSDIVIYHEMAESVTEQIVGRGRRVNRALPLRVHRLWT
jgi:hypothetical protein